MTKKYYKYCCYCGKKYEDENPPVKMANGNKVNGDGRTEDYCSSDCYLGK